MPLSEQEKRLLNEMERGLYHSDADDVTTVDPSVRANYTAVVVGILAGLAGIALLVTGVIARQPFLGLLGFVVMFLGALFAIAPPRRFRLAREASGSSEAGAARPKFMDQLNDRWERRNDEQR